MIRVHIHDQKGHRVLDAPLSPRPQQAPVRPQPGMTHEQAAQQHQAAAEHHVGLNFGQQNPISKAHAEAAKAHKTAAGLFGKPGYQQAAAWAKAASNHAGAMSKVQTAGQRPQQTAPQPPQAAPLSTGPTAAAGVGAGDYGTSEGARKRSQGVHRPGAPGYTPHPHNLSRQAIEAGRNQPSTPPPIRVPPQGPPTHEERRRMAGRLALLQQHSNAFTVSQHAPEIRRLQAALRQRDASPGAPKPALPKKPAAPKADLAPKPKTPKPPPPPKPKPPGTTFGKHVAEAPGAAAHVAAAPFHGVQRAAEGLNRLAAFGEHLRGDSATKDAGTSLGARRAHSARRHNRAKDEAEERTDWSSHNTVDAWFKDFDESKVHRGGNPENTGQFSKAGGSGASPEKKGEGKAQTPERHTPNPKYNQKDSPGKWLASQFKTPSVEEFRQKQLSAKDREMVDKVQAEVDATPGTDTLFKKDGKWSEERQQKHEEILASIFTPAAIERAMPQPGQQPTFVMLGGRGGAGKGFFTSKDRGGPLAGFGAITIDSDAIKAKLPGFKPRLAAAFHEEASDIVEAAVAYARDRLRCNLILDATMKTYSKDRAKGGGALERVEDFKDAKYRVEGHYMFSPPEVAAQNAIKRFRTDQGTYEGRYVPPSYVLSSTENEDTFDKLREHFDDWSLYDNSDAANKTPPRKIAAHGD